MLVVWLNFRSAAKPNRKYLRKNFNKTEEINFSKTVLLLLPYRFRPRNMMNDATDIL